MEVLNREKLRLQKYNLKSHFGKIVSRNAIESVKARLLVLLGIHLDVARNLRASWEYHRPKFFQACRKGDLE